MTVQSVVTEKNLPSRNRAAQSEFRKCQLINSTIDCIDRLGLSQTTLARIAKHAGVSQGIVVFHFQSKEALLETSLRQISQDYMECWKKAYELAAPDPVSRLCALVKAPFTPAICNRKMISVWYAFFGESRSRPLYMELCGRNDQAYSTELQRQCREIAAKGDNTLKPETAALSIECMIDGLWQNFLIGPPGFKRQEAIAAVFELMQLIYPDHRDDIAGQVKPGK